MRRRVLAALAAVLLGTGLAVAVATPAQAAAFVTCHGAGVVCLAEHRGGEGLQYGPYNWRPYGTCFNLPTWFNDKTSALWNKYGIDGTAPVQFTLYRDAGCSDQLYTWGPNAYVLWIGTANNDRATSGCLGPRYGTNNPPEGYCRHG